MDIEYKAIHTKGIIDIEPESGIVTAIVAVTGIEDNVKDIILPGAFEKSLSQRTPKGVWSHDWKIPVSKTLEAKELLPGDPELPSQLANGEPWPKNAGALKVKTQFNLNTNEGKSAYENVIFFDDDQEWSIGYQVLPGKSVRDSKGVRSIKEMNLYEYSPVLFGAMSNARSVKELAHEQLMSVKSILGEEVFREEVGNVIDDPDAAIEQKMGLEPGSIKALLDQQAKLDDIFEKVAQVSVEDMTDDIDDDWGLSETPGGQSDWDWDYDDASEDSEEFETEEKTLAQIFNSLEAKGYNTLQVRQAIGSMNVASLHGDIPRTVESADRAMSIIESDITSNDSYSVDLAELAQMVGKTVSESSSLYGYDQAYDEDDELDVDDDSEVGEMLPIADDEDDSDWQGEKSITISTAEFKNLLEDL